EEAALIRQWSTQSREPAPWYLHEQVGYNYRMSNVIAGVVRGQLPYLIEHIARKRAIRERYQKGFEGLPVKLDPINEVYTRPNYWLTCMTIDPEAMCPQRRTEHEAFFEPQPGRSCPSEILSVLASHNAEGRPIWRPMYLQPMYSNHAFVSAEGDVGSDIFRRGLCLPSDIKMTEEQQDIIIELIRRCFD
ncbi:MAG: DegT/DnrJ/EryC1/StrS family aminotransferase, partial [Clostridia bacterium]|nr:DegT/DnrJ/EryC1/StrS family aminotransferase [Clostridia bacterium]